MGWKEEGTIEHLQVVGNAVVAAEGSDSVKLWLGRVLQHPGLM